MERYVVIASRGRSGSNRVLDMFDLHADTVCRSELFGVKGTDFNRLPRGWFDEELDAAALQGWARAVARAPGRRSARDRTDRIDKSFFRPRFLAAAGQKLMGSVRARRLLSRLAGGDLSQEWPIPGLYLDRAALARALLVLKGAGPAWVTRVHAEDPRLHVVLNIRHPHDFLNSWYNRYIRGAIGDLADSERHAFDRSLRTIGRILARYGRSADAIGPFSREALIEVELWRWRFFYETILEKVPPGPRLTLATYEAIETDPVGVARQLYAATGLAFGDAHAAQVAAMRNTLFAEGHRHRLDEAMVERVAARVLDGSPLPGLCGAPAARA